MCLLLLTSAAEAGLSSGRALSCRDPRNGAFTRTSRLLDSPSPQIRALGSGDFTLSLWARFYFNSASHSVTPLSLSHVLDVVFLQPFAGDHGGYFAGSACMPMVATVSRPWEWHHYAMSVDTAAEETQFYLDGAKLGAPQRTPNPSIPLELDATFMLCAVRYIARPLACLPSASTWHAFLSPLLPSSLSSAHFQAALVFLQQVCTKLLDPISYASCVSDYSMNGELDDVAMWARALDEREVGEMWNTSISARVSAGRESDLILFYNFNNLSAATLGFVPNLGTGGSDFDLLLGELPAKQLSEHRSVLHFIIWLNCLHSPTCYTHYAHSTHNAC